MLLYTVITGPMSRKHVFTQGGVEGRIARAATRQGSRTSIQDVQGRPTGFCSLYRYKIESP